MGTPFNENQISGMLRSSRQPTTSPFLKPVNSSVFIELLLPATKYFIYEFSVNEGWGGGGELVLITKPQVGAVKTKRIEVIAHAYRVESVGAVWSRLKVSGGPANAAVRRRIGHVLNKVDLNLEIPLFVHGFALLNAHHYVRSHTL